MLQLDFAYKLLVLSNIPKHIPLPDDYTRGKKKKNENKRISKFLLVVKDKLYFSQRLLARMLYLVALHLRHKDSEVINCLCNMFFIQVYPLLITHTSVSKSGTY